MTNWICFFFRYLFSSFCFNIIQGRNLDKIMKDFFLTKFDIYSRDESLDTTNQLDSVVDSSY